MRTHQRVARPAIYGNKDVDNLYHSVHVLFWLPDGAAQPTIFTDVLYSRYLINTRLFGWCQIRHKFYLTGQNNDILVHTKGGECTM